jgi:hypothetical protein
MNDHAFELRDSSRYAINSPKVACQAFEGEALIIHFERGHYFSALGSAAALLALLEGGGSVGELRAALVRSCALDGEHAGRVIARFVNELLREELVVTVADDAPVLSPPVREVFAPIAAFEEPQLVKYTDLEDLLVLDPIHEVMLSAWPAEGS